MPSINQPPLLVGVDAGTTRIRALIYTPSGDCVAEGSSATPVTRPQQDWAQHDPEALWLALVSALRQALTQIDHPARIVGLACASVAEAGIPLDDQGRATYPAIAWFDQRTKPQMTWLNETIGEDRLFQTTGLHLNPMFGVCKLLWLKQTQPEIFSKTTQWLNLADYFAWRLCGESATDYSLASRTLALDLATLKWSSELLGEIGIPERLFQPLRASGTRLGSVSAAAAHETGLPPHCAIGVGGHDHMVGALAVGGWQSGTLLNSLGTAEALLLAQDQPVFDRRLAERGYSQGAMVVDKPRYYVVGAMTTSGACVEWFRETISNGASHSDLIAAAEQVPVGSDDTQFFPQMRVGTPPNKTAFSRGAFFGLSPDTSSAVMYRALLEGLAYDATYAVQALTELPDIPAINRILAIGGDSRNPLLMRIKAATYQQAITVVDIGEAVSLGAALLAGLAANVYSNMEDAASQVKIEQHRVEPNSILANRYADRVINYQRIVPLMNRLHTQPTP